MKLNKNKRIGIVFVTLILIASALVYVKYHDAEDKNAVVCICGPAGGVTNSPCSIAPPSGPCD